ncbi:MAG: hypothetical protein ACRCX2_12325 [Paraclostridium sp.]
MFNVGDKVRIRENAQEYLDSIPYDRDAIEEFVGIMDDMVDGEFCNIDFTITRKMDGRGCYPDGRRIMVYVIENEEGEKNDYVWAEEFFEPKDTGFWNMGIFEDVQVSEIRESSKHSNEGLFGSLSEFDGEPPF